MIQADKTGIPGKTMCFTILLYLVFIQIQRTADHMVSDTLHPHTEDFCFLSFGHTITSFQLFWYYIEPAKRRSFVHFRYPHGLRQVKNGIMRKTAKKRLFYIVFGEKTPFFTHFFNETNGGFQAAVHQTPSLENCETTAFSQCQATHFLTK